MCLSSPYKYFSQEQCREAPYAASSVEDQQDGSPAGVSHLSDGRKATGKSFLAFITFSQCQRFFLP